jgi:Protein of unknown function (DUF3551)
MREVAILCFAAAATATVTGAVTGSLTASALLAATIESHATEQPWCIVFGGSQGPIENCSMRTFEMCRQEAIAGNRGSCFLNPYYAGDWRQRSDVQHKGW